MKIKELFPGVFSIDNRVHTLASVSGYKPFDEKHVTVEGKEYREWDPNRSKAGAAIVKGIKEFPIHRGSKILYLGSAHGYTPSFFADIVGKDGIVYAVEFSERPFHDIMPIVEKFTNIVPIFADARLPEQYSWIERVDVVYVDVAQQDEIELAIRNCRQFLKNGGYVMIAIKTQSIDMTKPPKKVADEQIEKLKAEDFTITEYRSLEPFEDKHFFVIARML